jgi:hypothetical protein
MDLWLPPKPAIIRPAAQEVRQSGGPKKANFLPGWFPAGAVAGPGGAALEFIASTADASNLVTYTFAGQSFGVATPSRRIIVAASLSAFDSDTAIAVTIGGISATVHVSTINSGNTRNGAAAIASAAVPTGTSGSVVVDITPNGARSCVISVYRATDLSNGTPFDTASASDAGSLLIDIPANGFLIACAASVSGSGAHTWPSPMVNDIDTGLDGVQHSNAHTPANQAAATNFSAGPTSGGGGAPSRYAAATWA